MTVILFLVFFAIWVITTKQLCSVQTRAGVFDINMNGSPVPMGQIHSSRESTTIK